MKKPYPVTVDIGTRQPRFCTLSKEHPLHWTGFEGFRGKKLSGNCLSALILGWCYVVSASLVERRRISDQDKVTYTDEKVILVRNTEPLVESNGFIVRLGTADVAAHRWWAAILASGCGWQAVLHRSGHDYYPPWSYHLNGSEQFQILYDQADEPSEASFVSACPPSSAQALQYLHDFARVHNAYDQLLAAFAAVLTVPQGNRLGIPVVLPNPEPAFSVGKKGQSTLRGLVTSFRLLPHYLAYSCISGAVSSLPGSLWAPGVTCNLASLWLCPLLQELLPTLLRQRQTHLIVHMMAIRRPKSAPLWLGSALTGLLPNLINYAAHHPFYSLAVVEWTGSPQFFMDPQQYKKVKSFKGDKGKESISRADEFRLLYLTDLESELHRLWPPMSPWPPFGLTALRRSPLGVQVHAFCGHSPVYRYWVWQGKDG